MRRLSLLGWLCVCACVWTLASPARAAELAGGGGNSAGIGVHYWRNVDDGPLNAVTEDAAAWLLSYQFGPARLLKLETDLELYPWHFIASDSRVYAPQAYALVGLGIYGGLGAGMLVSGGKTSGSPFYAARAGLDIEVLPSTYFDLSLSYTVSRWEAIANMFDEFTARSVSIAAAIRYSL
jgi:hypothetical protein